MKKIWKFYNFNNNSFIIIIFIIPNYSYADDIGLGDLNSYQGSGTSSYKFQTKANKVFTIIKATGTVISVIMLTAIGIKFLLGSAEEKADYKKSLIPYIIGAAMIFLGSWLPQLIYDLTNEVFSLLLI